MNEVYIKLVTVGVASAIGMLLMHISNKRKIKAAKDEFELMMKARGLSLEPVNKKDNK